MNKREEEKLKKQQERLEKEIARTKAMSTFEEEYKDYPYICGIDEVGRGPLAGPVVAACVVLPEDFDVLGVDDSKKLSEKKREQLYDAILSEVLAYGIGMQDNASIDEINILEATKEAMRCAILEAERALRAKTGCGIDHILIDALTLREIAIPQTGIIKGDSASLSIAAASILAKVTRDRMMVEYDSIYPGYAFAKNKGYGTKAHYEGLQAQGMTPIHRRSFLKNFK